MDYKEWIKRIAAYYGIKTVSFNDDEFFFCYIEDKLINFSLKYHDTTNQLMQDFLNEYAPDFPPHIHLHNIYFMHEIGHIVLNTNIDPALKMLLDIGAVDDLDASARGYMRAPGEIEPTLWAIEQIKESIEVFEEFQQTFIPLLKPY